jgi:four helix bundle protein
MNRDELRLRTKVFALRVMKRVDALPVRRSANAIATQLVRSGTSVGANYRAACRGRSEAEFSAKLGVVVEEADETIYWLELITEGALLAASRVQPLLAEANELLALFSSAHSTLRKKGAAKRLRVRRRAESRNSEIPKSRNHRHV